MSMGFGAQGGLDHLTDDDVQLLRYAAAVLAAGLPLVAFLQLVRVYGTAMSQIADAEVRLFHLYVHEPLMRDGVPGWEMAEEMAGLAREILPLASPIMDHAHNRFLQHFIEQDVIGHMEADLGDGPLDLGRLRVAIAFADLAGYTRLTEEVGDEEAVSAVERFVEQVELSLPDDARIIKTIGDEVMVVGSDPGALLDWAVTFQRDVAQRPLPRIGMHYGETLYRDGDYYGREVNQASRVAARAAGGEVLVTRPVKDAARSGLAFDRIGEVRLKGFTEATELFLARQGDRRKRSAPWLSRASGARARPGDRAARRPGGGAALGRAGLDGACSTSRWRCSAPDAVRAVHVDYGLRGAASDGDREWCVELCDRLGVALEVERVARPEGSGNLQAWARDVRYARGAAAVQAFRPDARLAAGHTLSDQVETIMYRLAVSPGRRALLGMEAARGLLVRPLLAAEVTRAETATWCLDRGLAWREDASNLDRAFARARVREDLLPALRAVDERAEVNVLRTAALLREEAAVLDEVVARELEPDGASIAPRPARRAAARAGAAGPAASGRGRHRDALRAGRDAP